MTTPQHQPTTNNPGADHVRPTAVVLLADRNRHDTGDHPENGTRLQAVAAALRDADLLAGRTQIAYAPVDRAASRRVHTESYLDLLDRATTRGGAWLTPDTVVGPDSVETAELVSGAVTAAVDAVMAGAVRRAFVLGRPPGHHATADQGMGFCLLNHVAIGAAHALAGGATRVAVIDWDVHHGNGTQDIFYDSAEVYVCSVHQSPLYPGTGAASERGVGPGAGFTLNVPLPAGQPDEVYDALFREVLIPAVRDFAPDLILISAGFDAHRADPLGGMRLTEDGFRNLASLVVDLAEDVCGGRIVACLEGGYDPPALARSVIAVLSALDRQSPVPFSSEPNRPNRQPSALPTP